MSTCRHMPNGQSTNCKVPQEHQCRYSHREGFDNGRQDTSSTLKKKWKCDCQEGIEFTKPWINILDANQKSVVTHEGTVYDWVLYLHKNDAILPYRST